MARSPAKYQVYGLERNYIDLGEYQFKIVISPKFKSALDFSIQMLDSDRNLMTFSVERWGRKLNIKFVVSEFTPDGLAAAGIYRGDELIGNFSFWIIKP